MAALKFDQTMKDKAVEMAYTGMIDKEIIACLGIVTSTFYDHLARDAEFSEALKKAKMPTNIEVQNALLKRALGYSEIVKKPIKIKECEFSFEGKKISEKEVIVYSDEIVNVVPDVTAQIFWLKNRMPNEWRDRKEIGVTDDRVTHDEFLENLDKFKNEV